MVKHIKGFFADIFQFIDGLFKGFSAHSVTVIIPAYNESKRIKKVINVVKKAKVNDIIVVDDGSEDNTYNIAKSCGVDVIRHEYNRGKGAAIKTGIENANGNILLFLDADLTNITPKKIDSIINPIIKDEADFVKTSFTLKRGRVTELVVKPLLKVMQPSINFKQPISGQFALKKELVRYIDIDDRWGVDIQILLQLVKKEVRICEVDLGFLKHKKQPLKSKINMSEEVIRAVLSETGVIAKKHKLIIFDLDNTLIRERSIDIIAKKIGFYPELMGLREKLNKNLIKDYNITLKLAKILKGKTKDDFERICEKLTIEKNALKVIDRLNKRRYKLAIVSVAFSPIVEYFAKKLGITDIVCPTLIANKYGTYTGKVIPKKSTNPKCCDKIICKSDAAKGLMKKYNLKPEECIAVGDGKSDECLFSACGLSLVYRPKAPISGIKISDLSEILIYAD